MPPIGFFYYYKLFFDTCKHIFGLAGRLGYDKFPAVAKNIPIGQKRKRGRPSKCKKALIRQ
jgi:hypothetical protein